MRAVVAKTFEKKKFKKIGVKGIDDTSEYHCKKCGTQVDRRKRRDHYLTCPKKLALVR